MKTTTATLASIAVAGALTVAAPLSPVSSLAVSPAHAGGETNLRKIHRLQRAGARRGAYCAFYKGRNTFDEFPLAQSFSKRSCFRTANACKSWFYKVQSAFPITSLRKPCRRTS